MPETPLHITIASVPQTKTVEANVQLDLRNDIELVKAAVLYGDGATLYSIASSALLAIAAVGDIAQVDRWKFINRQSSRNFCSNLS